MKTYLLISQAIVALFLIVSILLQQRGTALGSAFGGGTNFYATRRGLQKIIFKATIFLGALFIILSLVNIII